MSKRIKPVITGPVIKTLEEADSALARIAALQRHVALINIGLNEDVAALKLKAAEQAEPLNAEIETLGASLARFGDYHKSELFSKKKSLALTFGTLGFRQATKLATIGKQTFKRVLEMLQDRNLDKYIRTKHEVDKEALKGAAPELLKTLSCKVKSEDEFFYETSERETVSPPEVGSPAGTETGEAA